MERVPNKPALQVKKTQTAPSTAGFRRGMDHNNYEGLALALFEETDDALILFDAKTQHILDVNAAAQRLCGIGIRDLLDTPVSNWFRSSGGDGLNFVSFPERKVTLPFAQWGNQLRTFAGDTWLSVDLTVTRLAVRPQPLVLLTVRGVAQAIGDDMNTARETDRNPAPQANCEKTASGVTAAQVSPVLSGIRRDLDP